LQITVIEAKGRQREIGILDLDALRLMYWILFAPARS